MKYKKNIFSTFWKYKHTFCLVLISVFLFVSLTYKFYIASYFVLVPILFVVYKKDLKTAVIFCAFVGLIASLFGFDWVYHYEPYLFVLTILVWTLFLISFATLTHLIYRKIKHLPLLIAPTVWIWLMLFLNFTKYGNYIFEFSMYNSLVAPLIWAIGGRGITFVVVLLNSVIAGFLIKRTKKRALIMIVISALLLFCYIFSSLGEASGEPLKVMLVQGDFEKSWEWRQEHAEEILDVYKKISGVGKDKDLIIWPEYTIPVDTTLRPWLFEKLQSIAKQNNVYFITGSIIYDETTGDHYDAALLFDLKGSMVDVYKSVYPAFYNKNTIKGEEGIKVFEIKGKKTGIMICAEETDSKIARLQSKKGAQFLISISNDQNLGRGVYLSSLYSKLRAAENYKYLVRATNTGITQVINPYGKFYTIEENKRNILIGEIRLNEHKTPYTRYGDIPLYALTFLVIIFTKRRRLK